MAYAGPTYVGKSTALASAASGSIDFTSSGRTSGDRLFIAVETANEVISAPSGFTEVPTVSPQFRGTAAAAGGVRITLFDKVSDGTETTVTIADSGDHQYAVGFVFRGTGGASIEASAGNNEALSTTGTFGGVTTSVGNCMVASFVATDNDQTGASWSAQTNANLTSLTERHDAGAADGNGGGIMLVTGEKEVAGATGNTTATHANTRAYCWITLALKHTTSSGSPYTLSAAVGAFTLSGQAVGLRSALRVTAAVGTFSLTGQAAGLVAARRLPAAVASFSLSGQASALKRDFLLTASAGNFTLPGQSADLVYTPGTGNRTLIAATGAFSLSGRPASLTLTRNNMIYGPSRSDNRTITGAARSDDLTITGPARNNMIVVG